MCSRQFLLSTGVPDERDTHRNVTLELITSAITLTKLKYFIPSKSPVFKTRKIILKKASNKGSFIFSHLFTAEYVVSCTNFKNPSHLRKGHTGHVFIVIFVKKTGLRHTLWCFTIIWLKAVRGSV